MLFVLFAVITCGMRWKPKYITTQMCIAGVNKRAILWGHNAMHTAHAYGYGILISYMKGVTILQKRRNVKRTWPGCMGGGGGEVQCKPHFYTPFTFH